MVLLDTQLLLWAAISPEKLPARARRTIQRRDTAVTFSLVSIWEVAIKLSLGRPEFRVDPRALREGLLGEGFTELAITADAVLLVANLPWVHRDPFDRLLVAQAQAAKLSLLTADRTLLGYGPAVKLAT